MSTPAVDHRSPLPLHLQVQTVVRRLIARAPYRDGAVLPDEIGLARQLRVGRGTVRQAIGALVSEGLLERRRGVGTRVAPRPIAGRLSAFTSFSREMAEAGIAVRLIAGSGTLVAADASQAAALEVAVGSPVRQLVRVRGDDDGPIAAFTSWLHPRCGLRDDEDLSRPLYQLIAARGGPRPAAAAEELGAVAASQAVARLLECPVGAPVLERRRRVRDAAGACFEYAIVHYRSDRFSLRMDQQAEED